MPNRFALLAAGALMGLGVASGVQAQMSPEHRSGVGHAGAGAAPTRPTAPVVAPPAVPRASIPKASIPTASVHPAVPGTARGPIGPVGVSPDLRMEERRMADHRDREGSRDEGHRQRRFDSEERHWREHGPHRGGWRDDEPRH